jgi:hypothetical protein
MNVVLRDPLDALTNLPDRAQLDAILAEDQWQTRQALASCLGDPSAFVQMSDLEVACAYKHGDATLVDALSCELHRRSLNPWALDPFPVLDASP